MDMNGVLRAVFDPVNNRLATSDAGPASGNLDGGLDENGVWAAVFDPATNSLRTVSV